MFSILYIENCILLAKNGIIKFCVLLKSTIIISWCLLTSIKFWDIYILLVELSCYWIIVFYFFSILSAKIYDLFLYIILIITI